MNENLWSAEETSQFLGISIKTLYAFNYKRTGPTFYRIGKYVRFIPEEVRNWVRSQQAGGAGV